MAVTELFEIPGWGVVFAAWALAVFVGGLMVGLAAVLALRARAGRGSAKERR